MYKILINNDLLGYVEDVEDGEKICDVANKYNSLASDPNTDVYSIEKVFMDDIIDYIPRVYLQIQIRMSPRKRFVIDIGVYKSRNISDALEHDRNKNIYTLGEELAMTYLVPKQNESVEELKDRCLKTAIDIINLRKEWKDLKEYEIYLNTPNGQERVERKDD